MLRIPPLFSMALATLVTLTILPFATLAQADDPAMITVTGEISYLQRIALHPGSIATVTVSDVSLADAKAPVLAETSIPGKQVPIAFSLDVPTDHMRDHGRYALRATIHDVGGALRWTTDTHIPVNPAEAMNDVGVLTLVQVTKADTSKHADYLCGDHVVSATFTAETLKLTIDGEHHDLVQTRSASGARYETEDGSLVFWDRGKMALLQTGGNDTECALQPTRVTDITGGTWRVEDIGGGGVIDASQTSLEFSTDGRVSGRGGCNQYSGSYTREGDTISFGPLATTQMACIPALGDQEQKFYQVLSTPVTISFDDTGALILTNENGETLLARR